MTRRDPRSCPWLTEPHGEVVTITPAAWWLAMTRNARAVRYRTDRQGGLRILCHAKKASEH